MHQASLPVTDDLWRLTVEHSPVGTALVSITGDFLTANAALCDMLGYDAGAMTTMAFQDITHPDDLASDLALATRTLAGTIPSYRITKRYIRADGSLLVGDLSVALLRDADGAPLHFISQIADLTERHAFAERLDAAEAAVESEQRKAEAVFDTVAVGLLLLDADGTYQGYNSRHQDFMDLAFPHGHRGRVGQTGYLYDAEQARPLSSEEMPTVRAVAGEEFDDFLIWVGEDPESRRALSVSARSVRDRVGTLTGAALAYQDVTELMRAIRVKDDFVTSISHELRTPLTSAMAHLELLEDSAEIGPAARPRVAAARRNVQRLSHLVADLLFSTRATSGSPLVDPYRVDLVTILAEALEAAAVDAAQAGVTLESDLPDSLVAVVDGMRLRQLVDNLVCNAIAYTPRGGRIVVAVTSCETHVQLSVADDGEGIDPEDRDHVFNRFYRGRNARRLQVPGTGLGLSIVRAVAEAHGGGVSLESTPGGGTTVCVVLPR
ncbi:PAS domain-containing sensor histidine kinase [Nocardioides sp. SYSU D00065]|uniref:PAS domain-containing sensor histidine kinase n=1 Tax=Nocardioides sp. SYSU D00065 TaxID=2817378 RepID=UPI001B319055|nr:PAS domain-containing sensor histidine kinase [Nocardioides sp. SYSU D00065]